MKISKIHLAKTISWRVIGTLDTLIFAWLVSGNLSLSIDISIITTFTKMVWYYIHERVWFRSKYENHERKHIYKTFTWRAIGSLDTIIFSWIILGDPMLGLSIGLAEVVTKMILYYFHEKIWFKFKISN